MSEFPSQKLVEMWADFASNMTAAGMAASPGDTPTDAARKARTVVLDGMSKQSDRFLRSPEFLAVMKRSLDAAIALQKQRKEFFTAAHHATQSPAQQDIDAVLTSIRHLEGRVLQRLDALSSRMDAFENGRPKRRTRNSGNVKPKRRAPGGRKQ